MTREELKQIINDGITEIFVFGNNGQYLEAQAKLDELVDTVLERIE